MTTHYLRSGHIVLIGNSSSNINPYTGMRNIAKYGVITRSDDYNNIYYLPIELQKFNSEYGKYLSVEKLQISKSTLGQIEGYINFETEYKTNEQLPIIGNIVSDVQIYEILDKFSKYQKKMEEYKPVLDMKKIK